MTQRRFESCNDIFGRHIGNNIVAGRKYETAVIVEGFGGELHFVDNILHAAEGKRGLGGDPAAPEGKLIAILLLEHLGVHALGGQLHGIQAIHAHICKIIQIRNYAAAGMIPGFPVGILMYPIVYALVIGLIQLAEG